MIERELYFSEELEYTLQIIGLSPSRLLRPWDSPGKNTGGGYHFLLQGIFPTQGSNRGLLYYRQTLYHLSHQGSPVSDSSPINCLCGLFSTCKLDWILSSFHFLQYLNTAFQTNVSFSHLSDFKLRTKISLFLKLCNLKCDNFIQTPEKSQQFISEQSSCLLLCGPLRQIPRDSQTQSRKIYDCRLSPLHLKMFYI